MRTKNAKRLWPVPATLAFVAMAAFLAFGLMATIGAQPAVAQSAPCVTVTEAGDTAGNPDNAVENDAACDVTGSQALIKLSNNSGTKKTYYVFAGGIGTGAVYPDGSEYVNGAIRTGSTDDSPVAKPLGYLTVEVNGRTVSPGTAEVMIPGGALTTATVYVYTTDVFPETSPINDASTPPKVVGRELPAPGTGDATIIITFLGSPVENAPDDHGEADPNERDADTRPEPRSHLSVVEDSRTIGDDEDAITVTAQVQDQSGNNLQGKITYTVTYVEGSALKSGQQSYTTRAFDFPTAGGTTHTHAVEGWLASGAVAVEVSAMFSGETGPIALPLVTVDAATDEVKKVPLTRTGDATEVKTATFSVACLIDQQVDPTAVDLTDDTFVAPDDNDDCVMDARFGRTQTFLVKAHLEDKLGSTITNPALVVELESGVDKPLATSNTPLASNTVATATYDAWLYTVDKAAMFGDHMITVKFTIDPDVEDVVLTVAVAGPPATLSISGAKRIALNDSEDFTVTALDETGGIPDIITMMDDSRIGADDRNHMVSARVLNVNASNVEGIDDGMITLDDMGMATITVYGFGAAMHSQGLIIVGDGDMRTTYSFAFGPNRDPMGAAIADVMMTMGDDPMMVEAMFTDADGQDLTYEWMSSDEMVATVMADDMDMSMASITAVGPGTAMITVTATDTEGGMGMQTIMVTVEYANVAPMAGADIDPVMMTVGDDPMMAATMFTDANMDDMLSYTPMSSDEMVATAMVDMDGMVTITAVGAGEATITVTATDMDGESAMQTIMVTVEEANVAPMAGADIDPVMMTVGDDPRMVATMFTDANMDDMLSYTPMSSDEMVATAMVDMDGMVTITAVGAGEATITVTATDMDGESAMQTIMVTVTMATTMMDELGTVTDVITGFNRGGALQVSWTKAANASGYIIIAININDVNNDVVAVVLNDGDLDTRNISGLTPGATYDIYVAATASGGRNTLSDAARVTAK